MAGIDMQQGKGDPGRGKGFFGEPSQADGVLAAGKEQDGTFKLLITRGYIGTSQDNLRGTWSWVEVADLKKLYATLVHEGFTHHASLIHGDYCQPLADACQFLGIEPVIV